MWGPPKPNGVIGEIEEIVVAYCTTPGRGTRLMPEGTLKSAHFVRTPDYVQVTGTGDFTKIGIKKGDEGGELDPHGADKLGNPHGGLVFSNAFSGGSSGLGVQMHEWTNFQSATEFCIRACKDGPGAKQRCQHIYGQFCIRLFFIAHCNSFQTSWAVGGTFLGTMVMALPTVRERALCKFLPHCIHLPLTPCSPMGLYPQPDGSTSTFKQGQPSSPPAHPAGSTSMCTTIQSFASGTAVVRTANPTTDSTATGTWTTGTPTGTAASSNNAAVPAFAGDLSMALASVVVAALGAVAYVL